MPWRPGGLRGCARGLGTPARRAGQSAWGGHRDTHRQRAWRTGRPHPASPAPPILSGPSKPHSGPPSCTQGHWLPGEPSTLRPGEKHPHSRPQAFRPWSREGPAAQTDPGRRAATRGVRFLSGKKGCGGPSPGAREATARRPELRSSSCHRARVAGRIVRPVVPSGRATPGPPQRTVRPQLPRVGSSVPGVGNRPRPSHLAPPPSQ